MAGCNNTKNSEKESESATSTQIGTSTQTLTIAANSTTTLIKDGETESGSTEFYKRIVWEETGRLVIGDGNGLGIVEGE
jgi:hypothetical protein